MRDDQFKELMQEIKVITIFIIIIIICATCLVTMCNTMPMAQNIH